MARPAQVQLDFPVGYAIEILPGLATVSPEVPQHFFPKHVDEIERGALIARITPEASAPWVGIFGLGFDSDSVVHGVFSTPSPEWLAAISGGYGYLVKAARPEEWKPVGSRPVVGIRSAVSEGALLFWDFLTVSGFTSTGKLWQTPPLSWEGLAVGEVRDGVLHGAGWDALSNREIPFTVDVLSGQHTGGARKVR